MNCVGEVRDGFELSLKLMFLACCSVEFCMVHKALNNLGQEIQEYICNVCLK